MSNWRDQIFDSLHVAETTRSGPGAVAITAARAIIITTGVDDAMTLADGVPGQVLIMTMRTDAGAGIVTPVNLWNFTTITFNNVGDWAAVEFDGLDWRKVGGKGAVFA